jgi:hypothetical protein
MRLSTKHPALMKMLGEQAIEKIREYESRCISFFLFNDTEMREEYLKISRLADELMRTTLYRIV